MQCLNVVATGGEHAPYLVIFTLIQGHQSRQLIDDFQLGGQACIPFTFQLYPLGKFLNNFIG
jgi:hypothetical protein